MAKRKTTRKAQRINLVDLPPSVLLQIFHEVADCEAPLRHFNFLICQALLPYTLVSLYRIGSCEDLRQFVAALQARPSMLEAVSDLRLAGRLARFWKTGSRGW
ncbi:hypothetical protein JCM8547_006442 [Rhodosporidiobolus lusitaniae]